jgi:hypothetical protein
MCFGETRHVFLGDAACAFGRRSMCFEETRHVLWGDDFNRKNRTKACLTTLYSLPTLRGH